MGSGLSSTHLIELTEISSSKIIMCKSLGVGRRIMGHISLTLSFLEILIINHLQ